MAFGSIDRRATALDIGVGDTLNRAMLINLARANRNEPLYFLNITQAAGSAMEDARLGVPAFSEGTRASNVLQFSPNGSTYVDSQVSSNFDIAVVNSKDFYAGLLSPLSLSDVNLLISQGYSRQLVFFLAIDSIRVTRVDRVTGFVPDLEALRTAEKAYVKAKAGADASPKGPAALDAAKQTLDAAKRAYYADAEAAAADTDSMVYRNDPTLTETYASNGRPADPDRLPRSFRDWIYEGIAHGLTTESVTTTKTGDDQTVTTEAPGSAPGVRVFITAQPSAPAKGQGGGQGGGGAGASGGETKVRLCYDFTLADHRVAKDFDPDRSPVCGRAPEPDDEQTQSSAEMPVKIGAKLYEIEVRTRSIFAMFHYLGLMMNHPVDLVDYSAAPYDIKADTSLAGPLLNVTHNRDDCFTSVTYAGEDFCVPNKGSENTKAIFNIIGALLQLKTSPGDLPITQTVRLTQ